MGLVQAAWEGGRVAEVVKLLNQEKADNPDLCRFEWNYWKRQCNQETRTLSIPELGFWKSFSADGTRLLSHSPRVPVSPDGTRVVYRVIDWTVWDTTSGKKVASLVFPEGDAEHPCLSPDGSLLAICLQTPDDKATGAHEYLLTCVEVSTGRRLAALRHLENSPGSLSFSSDGRKLAGVITPHGAGGRPAPGAALHIWDARTCDEIRVVPGMMWAYQSPAFSPDGTRVAAVVVADGSPSLSEIKIWDIDSSREVASFPTAAAGGLWSWLGFSPDGQALAAVGESPAGCVLEVWDMKTKRSRFTLHGPSNRFRSQAVFSPDSRLIAYALSQLQVGVWDASNGRELAHYQGHLTQVISLSFSRDGRNLLSADNNSGTVKVWDCAGHHQCAASEPRRFSVRIGRESGRTADCDKPDAKGIRGRLGEGILGRRRRLGRDWPVAPLAHEIHGRKDEPSRLNSVAWSARGDRLAYATTSRGAYMSGGGSLTVWDLDGKELFNLDEDGIGFSNVALEPRRYSSCGRAGSEREV